MRSAHDVLFVGFLPEPSCVTGGMEIIVHDLLTRLAERNYRVRALAPGPPETPPVATTADHENAQVDITRYPVPGRLHEPTSLEKFDQHSRQIGALFPALVKQRRPDIVLVGHTAYIASMSTLTGAYGLPWIAWSHSPLAPMIFGDGLVPEVLSAKIMAELRQAELVVTVAQHLAQGAEGLGLRAVEAVTNGIDLRLFQPRAADPSRRVSLGLGEDDIVVFHASNLRRVKRGMDIVDAAELALDRNPSLFFVLTGAEEHRRDVETACRDRGLGGRFRFTGWIDRADVARYLNLADIAVMTSQTEGLALAYLEAQASACPLIASDIPAAREVIRDGKTGRLFPVGDTEALALHILALAADTATRASLGQQARAHAEQHHGIERMADRFCALLDAIVAGAR